ncbi:MULTISPECIES: alpha-xenorhabdolysin family binary toxin subunit A [unclassified Pseudomonas]|uniref:alpha-xenorhabdolysin family binary toxin subunit A n=1 Tax=unclassified Pseudomonas TaxID=196821 RepID=UPI002AC8AD9A|nr:MULTISPECIES: alpha-xenorhabdolysin family binary toxin subunit A [unclassified Pseudomonas]MEB0044207.1 alpha-xenorhabdolysin family binary toxin subunit A [Pseudomonas sp. Dout3]MEB0094856.1 alpha-xenorhabdolysin family binary toxin subunit A [Pseudomonas sp. DC1.2]WPX59783.1 alpha-xenorhabdolysin family binary toxin subunit A [Pseudomonas sp. DC1.2]
MEFKMDNKIVEAAVKAPKLFVSASLGEGEDYNREPGIQLTKEQIISLRKYEALGLSLPIRLQDVIAYLNYGAGDGGGVGLKAADFLRTFSTTYDHARRWSPLREKIMLTGTDLKIFGGSIIRIGNGIVEVYEDLKASKYLEEHNITTPAQYLELKRQIPNLPELGLPAGDVPEIKVYLNDMLVKVRYCHDKAERVRVELDSFGTDMREKVVPELKLRLEFVSKNTYQADILAQQKDIDQRAADIDDLNKQYDQLVQEAIKAAASLNIGGLILGIYQGVKAENIRKERNRLRDEQQAAIQTMASKNQTLSSLNRVRDDLQNLNYVAIEAEVATQNLMLVWNALSLYIAESMKEVDLMDNAISLRKFKNQINSIIEPWEYIKTSSDQLLAVFAAADKEYENTRSLNRVKKFMNLVIGHSVHQPFNMAALIKHNGIVQQSHTSVQMLFQQFDYASGAVGTMSDLASAINRVTFDVRKLAQTNSINLERTARKLTGYQAELGDPDDDDEIRQDMEDELMSASRQLSAQTEDLKSIHKSMSTPYDRTASKAWTETLQKDRAFDELRKTDVEEKLVVLNVQMKAVSEAIELIGKAGIEKIGEEAQLSLDSLKALGLAPPQVQIALLAIDTLKKIISGIGEAISYLNMLAGYNRLKDKASDLRAQAEKYAKAIALINGRIELVTTLDALDEQRWEYVSEFSNLVTDFEKIASGFKQDTSLPVEERAGTAIVRIADVIKYLNTVQH